MGPTELAFRRAISRRLRDALAERGQSYSIAAEAMGLRGKNMLFRLLHVDDPAYEPVARLAPHLAALDYCGIGPGDLERKAPASMSEVLSAIDALPGLEPADAHVLRTTCMSLYCALREGRE